jgi:hypothetical protein
MIGDNGKANLTVLTTSCCTLNCKLCATYVPLVKKHHHYDTQKMMSGIHKFFEAMGEVRLFTLSGGEPFLNPDIDKIILCGFSHINQIEKFEIITNGTVVPGKVVLELLQKSDKVDLMIDNYGDQLSDKVLELTGVLSEYGIKYRVRNYTNVDPHMGGWLNTSDFTEKHRDKEDIYDTYHRCMYSNTFKDHYFLINGTFHMCYVNFQLLDFIEAKEGEYVDFSQLSTQEMKEQLSNLRNRKCLSACENCNGYIEEGKRYMPAQQVV